MGFIPPFYFYTLCDATCGDVVYVRRNAAFTLHLGYVTGDMKWRESNETPHQNDRNYVHELNGLTFDSLRKNLAWWAVTRKIFNNLKHHKNGGGGGGGGRLLGTIRYLQAHLTCNNKFYGKYYGIFRELCVHYFLRWKLKTNSWHLSFVLPPSFYSIIYYIIPCTLLSMYQCPMGRVSLFTGLDYWTDLFATKNQFYAL